MKTRAALITLGAALAGYGVWLLLSRQDLDQLISVGVWLVVCVVAHDALLAPAVIAVAWLGARILPARIRGPLVIGMLVLGSLTVLAIPVLLAAGRRPDNPTLLDRDYMTGWLVVAGCVVTAVVVAVALRSYRASRSSKGGPVGPRPGR